MISKGLRRLLEYEFGYTEVFSVTSCNELMKELNKKKHTHLVVDIGLSDGSALEVLPTIQKLYPSLCIMVFSAKSATAYEKALKQYGIYHYLSKEAGENETNQRLRQFFQNEQPARDPAGMGQSNSPFSDFTPRELEILHYMLKGIGTNEIAKALNLKWNTISTVKNRIFEKTTTTNLIELKELATLCKVS
jgi:two-component system, NarL family, invasion response regulator UvrY